MADEAPAVEVVTVVETEALLEEKVTVVTENKTETVAVEGRTEEVEAVSKRAEKKICNGMGFLLQQLRFSAEQAEPVIAENPSDSTVPEPKLNRKERRALLQGKRTTSDIVEEEPPAPKKSSPVVVVEYSFANPKLLAKETSTFLEKVPAFGFASSHYSNNYVKLAKFSPDGQFLLTTSQDRVARVFRLESIDAKLSKTAHIPLGDVPYEAVWHPCGDLFATSSNRHPIHLWNSQGEREASYRGIDHLDELVAAQTMVFSNDGLRLYAGYHKCLKIWDVRRPGRHQQEIRTWKNNEGQKSKVSAIAMHPLFDGVYAVGTYGTTIGLYSDRTNFVECLFSGDFPAVTDLRYSPDGMRLYSSGRKTGTIQCFDMRKPGSVLFTLHRPFDTQQRVYFEVDRSENYLFSGTSDGEVVVFDLKNGEIDRDPVNSLKISASSVPCVSLHPTLPILAACTGERVFPYPQLSDEDEEKEEESADRAYLTTKTASDLENALQLWEYGS